MQKDSSTVRVEKSCKFHINNYSRSDEFLAVRVCSVFVLFCFYCTLKTPGESMLTGMYFRLKFLNIFCDLAT